MKKIVMTVAALMLFMNITKAQTDSTKYRKLKIDEVNFLTSYYHQNGNNSAVTGGIGTIPGAVIGAFVMGVINQGLSIMGVDTAVVKTIKGLVLLLAVAVDIMSKRKKS